jgi:hypothetical protein
LTEAFLGDMKRTCQHQVFHKAFIKLIIARKAVEKVAVVRDFPGEIKFHVGV